MPTDCDEIASAVLDEFRKLPTKRKPCVRDNGLHEWVPLAGIVAKGPGWIRCVALATGMKCLPASKLPQANGTAIHDWHAEVLAIRSFNYFVLEECRRLSLGGDEPTSDFIRRRNSEEIREHQPKNPEGGDEDFWHGQPFAWTDNVSLHMYCSEAPCGDASMELIMAAQDDASPWDIPPGLPDKTTQDTPNSGQNTAAELLGRGYFSQLGIVRRKPSRGDAPPSLSKSCSDKLALKQCTSLLSSLSSLFVSPTSAYLTSIILPESQYSPTGWQRCFSATPSEEQNLQDNGRMKPLHPYLRTTNHTTADSTQDTTMLKAWKSSGYAFVPFKVHTSTLEFDFSKRTVAAAASSGTNMAASNLAVAWSANGLNEGMIGGVLQGRKKFDIKGASSVSRRKLWKLASQVAENLAVNESGHGSAHVLVKCLSSKKATYDEVKGASLMKGRRAVKEESRREALKGWVRNTGDGGFRLSD